MLRLSLELVVVVAEGGGVAVVAMLGRGRLDDGVVVVVVDGLATEDGFCLRFPARRVLKNGLELS